MTQMIRPASILVQITPTILPASITRGEIRALSTYVKLHMTRGVTRPGLSPASRLYVQEHPQMLFSASPTPTRPKVAKAKSLPLSTNVQISVKLTIKLTVTGISCLRTNFQRCVIANDQNNQPNGDTFRFCMADACTHVGNSVHNLR
jgi:hypothetical protein